jgi:hypothetical protein
VGEANRLSRRRCGNHARCLRRPVLGRSEFAFPELLFGALGVPEVTGGLLVRPALFPRFAEAARGCFARPNSAFGELGFHGCSE